jgi:hypothetical protein
LAKIAYLTRNNAKLCKNWFVTSAFKKNANFFAENRQKLSKLITLPKYLNRAGMYVHGYLCTHQASYKDIGEFHFILSLSLEMNDCQA